MSDADQDTETLAPRVDARSAGKLASAILVVAVGVSATYAVPQLAFARPWTAVDPVPFWNLMGRYARVEGEESFAAQQEKLEAIEDYADDALARAKAATKLNFITSYTAEVLAYMRQARSTCR